MTTRPRRGLALVATALAAASMVYPIAVRAEPPPERPASPQELTAEQKRSAAKVRKLNRWADNLSDELRETTHTEEIVLVPIAILVAILAAGGGLGIVFSFRDQRRVSQLHELTVGGEVASQRRSEQSYGAFLEQSQTTLSLVNDTLEIAKEATDHAARSMEHKAKSRIAAIEERAQKLLIDVFGKREFELLINNHDIRGELHAIAEEVRSLEGYLNLQDIELRHYTKFIKAIDQFLLDDTESALEALRLASQDQVVGELQRFIEYWLGYMLTTVGEYEEAIDRFQHDEINLTEEQDKDEYFQLERIISETEFFAIAKAVAQADAADSEAPDQTPQQRFKAVVGILDRLAVLAEEVETGEDRPSKQHTSLEVARTRADVYEWVAYDRDHLDEPIDEQAVPLGIKTWKRYREVKAGDLTSSPAWGKLSDPDVFRAWALRHAQEICKEQENRNLDVEFALAECYFKLRHRKADSAFEKAEHALEREFGEEREKRRKASVQQSLLICHSRLLDLRRGNKKERVVETRQVLQASRSARGAVNEMRQASVTVFSQIQRRNITQGEFKKEIDAIVEQDHIRSQDE